MTVKELKSAIENLPDEMEVIIQKDSEGNGYSPCAGADPDAIFVRGIDAWYGEVYATEWSAEDACMGENEWKLFKANNPRALILHPIS